MRDETDRPSDTASPSASHRLGEAEKRLLGHVAEVSANARTTWFGLLGLLAFMGVTLLSHRDVDFFARGARTDLPLIGIEIPVYGFFITAPLVVGAVYIYLHLYLISLWTALSDAPDEVGHTRLSEAIYPWLLSRTALSVRRWGRGDRSSEPYAMDWLTVAVSITITWAAGPAVLGLFWARSWPNHDPWLSLWLALCLFCVSFVGLRSLILMLLLMVGERPPPGREGRRDRRHSTPGWVASLAPFAVYALVAHSLAATGALGPLWSAVTGAGAARPDWRAFVTDPGAGFRVAEASDTDGRSILIYPPGTDWPALRSAWHAHLDGLFLGAQGSLERADMSEEELVVRPPDLPGYEAWFDGFDRAWRAENGVPSGQALPLDRLGGYWRDARTAWRWRIAGLKGPPLKRRDLHRADLTRAVLTRADLRGARLDLADMERALLDGADLTCDRRDGEPDACTTVVRADLSRAEMQGAELGGVEMQGAVLVGAEILGADLAGAKLQGADLSRAEMQGTVLSDAALQGARLASAVLHGADLSAALMHGAVLSGAELHGAILYRAELEGADLSYVRMHGASLEEAVLARADLSRGEMFGVRLAGADLEGATLAHAKLRGAACAGARFDGAAAPFADLTCAGLEQAQLVSVTGNNFTRLPLGLYVRGCGPDARDEESRLYFFMEPPRLTAVGRCPDGTRPRKTGRWVLDDGREVVVTEALWRDWHSPHP